MFKFDVPAVAYADPWLLPFEQRFLLLTLKERHVAYFYHKPDDSTFRYRIYNMIQTLNTLSKSTSASWFCLADEKSLDRVIQAADIIVICRTPYSILVNQFVDAAHRAGRTVIFDTDDLVFQTDHIPLIMDTLAQDLGPDGPWDYWYSYIGRIGDTLGLCDRSITTNDFLAGRLQSFSGRPVSIIPNFLNREQLDISNRILEAKRALHFAQDNRVHLGYFSGSPSHNNDFRIIAAMLARLMDSNPSLVVRIAGYLGDYPCLHRHRDRVEIHPFRDFVNLQTLIGSTEINLVPLQDNIFTNCKSELKYFEASAVGCLTVASPTHAYRQSIQDGINGFIANEHEWEEKLLTAIDSLQSARYLELIEAAHKDSILKYSWENQINVIEEALFFKP